MSALREFHERVFMPNVRLLAEQQLRGILVDQEILKACRDSLTERITTAMSSFLQHPQVVPHIAEYNREVHAAWSAAQPARWNTTAVSIDQYLNDPKYEVEVDGDVIRVWLKEPT
jgi:phosphoglycerate dehydrogenase-like enzyme